MSINQSTLYFHQKQYIKTILKHTHPPHTHTQHTPTPPPTHTHTKEPYGGVDWKANKAC